MLLQSPTVEVLSKHAGVGSACTISSKNLTVGCMAAAYSANGNSSIRKVSQLQLRTMKQSVIGFED